MTLYNISIQIGVKQMSVVCIPSTITRLISYKSIYKSDINPG